MDNAQLRLPNPKKRLTIGLLSSWIESEYQAKIVNGAVNCAREKQINLLCFEGGTIISPFELETGRNIIFDLIDPDDLDGLVIITTAIGNRASHDEISAFVKHYDYMPTVCINTDIAGSHRVMIDNDPGFRELLFHLIDVHQYRRFAFLKGSPDHRDTTNRYEIFKAALRERGIPLDENLVVEGDFTSSTGEKAIETLIDIRKTDFEVLVSCNDEMALGALNELNQRGIKVPDQIAVVGFDDIEQCSYSSPPLTSVSQSLEEQGRISVELLLDVIACKNPPEKIIRPTKMILRESCGCFSQSTLIGESVISSRSNSAEPFLPALLPEKENVAAAIIKKVNPILLHLVATDLPRYIQSLTAAFYGEIFDRKKGQFIKVMYDYLDQTSAIDENIFLWQSVVLEMRRQMLPLISDAKMTAQIEDLIHQAQALIGEKAVVKGKMNYQQIMQTSTNMNYISEELLSIITIPELHRILEHRLPHLNIDTFYLLELEERAHGTKCRNRLTMAYHKNKRLNIDDENEYSTSLVPEFIFEDTIAHAMFIMPLVFSKTQFGIIGLEIHLENFRIYETLRRIIGASLNGILLTKQLQDQEKHLIAQKEHLRNLAEMRKAMEGFIRTISLTVEVKDPYTAGHQNRVADLARTIATEMNLSQAVVECVRMAAMVHDLGKISIPAEILNKPGKLTDLELNFIKDHPRVAYDILKNIELPWPIAEVIYEHHERLNGSGYPQGLKGDDIMLESRIIAVADVIEAMASHRPYRPALGIEEALKEITRNRGTLYDPVVVDSCVALFQKDIVLLPINRHFI